MPTLKKEPALIIGVLVSVLALVGQVVAGDVTWAAAVPLIATAVTRFFVSPANDGPERTVTFVDRRTAEPSVETLIDHRPEPTKKPTKKAAAKKAAATKKR
jgi:hypothetical protein